MLSRSTLNINCLLIIDNCKYFEKLFSGRKELDDIENCG